MVLVEVDCFEAEGIQQQCAIGKCVMANMDQVKEQLENCFSGDFELVSCRRGGLFDFAIPST